MSDPTDFTRDDNQAWGGLIILGDATIARTGGETGIEGIDAAETRARFGGTQDDDNSGRLNYVSIRHGGTALTANNEINGLTLGGVGSGTEMDYIEIFANFDDGIEFFGGTVDVKHLAVAFCGDDAVDYDFGYRGRGQYWFSLQGPILNGTGRAGEHDGASPDNEPPFAQPNIFNATYIGIGENETAAGGDAADDPAFGVILRDNAGGFYNNSIFTDFNGHAIAVEDRDDSTDDAFARLEAGDLAFNNNFFFGFGAGSDPEQLWVAVDQNEVVVPASTTTVANAFVANGNQVVNPVLQDISNRNSVDPRPSPFSPAASGAPAPTDDFFDTVDYYGAFGPGNGADNPTWLEGWTAIDEYSFLDLAVGVGAVEQAGFLLDAPVPNPSADIARVNFELPRATEVTMMVLDIYGRQVQRVLDQASFGAGEQNANIDVSRLPNGNYIVVLRAGNTQLLQKMVVNR